MTEAIWQTRVERAERARREAEALLEAKCKMLLSKNYELRELAARLEQRVNERTKELIAAREEARQAAEELAAARDAAQRASLAKSEFLASMSHEIRTPLAAIMGYADLLEAEQTDPETSRDWTHALRLNAEHLLTLVGDVLDLSKIEAGKLELEIAPADLEQQFQIVAATIDARAREKGLAFGLEVRGPVPRMLTTDAVRVRQIVLNLASNAVKFTESGSVRLVVGVREDEGHAGETAGHWLTVACVDTGRGISSSDLERIFAPFTQVGERSIESRAGTGLGLDISRRLADALGGSIEVRSTVGEGSTFTLALPIAAQDMDDLVAMELGRAVGRRDSTVRGEPLGGRRVLLVDDSLDNRRILALMLERAGATVATACDGEQAIAHLRELDNREEVPEVVIMDLQMPGVDGYEAASIMRRAGFSMPILALSADATAQAKERASKAGCDDYLTKPVVGDVLTSKISSLLAVRQLPRARKPKAEELSLSIPQWLLEEYVASLCEQARVLRDLQRAGDVGQIRVIAHRLVGSGASYGFPGITEMARACEQAIDDGAGPTPLARHLEALLEQLDRVTSRSAA